VHSSLFVKYGGFSSIHSLVENFYDKLLSSKAVGEYFKASDMETLITHQNRFLSSLLGGPVSFSDQHLKSVHHHLNINEEDWNEVTTLLELALVEFGMEKADSDMLIKKLSDKKGLFLCSQ
jgi:hemoglobin